MSRTIEHIFQALKNEVTHTILGPVFFDVNSIAHVTDEVAEFLLQIPGFRDVDAAPPQFVTTDPALIAAHEAAKQEVRAGDSEVPRPVDQPLDLAAALKAALDANPIVDRIPSEDEVRAALAVLEATRPKNGNGNGKKAKTSPAPVVEPVVTENAPPASDADASAQPVAPPADDPAGSAQDSPVAPETPAAG